MPQANHTVACLECKQKIGTIRGCCNRCRNKQHDLVRRGDITEQELIATGKLLPVAKAVWRGKKRWAVKFR